MEFETELARIAEVIRNHREVLLTEEAAKNALVMPFIRALGYNVFDPGEVVPEYTCDVGIKKGEKVDYAVCEADSVRILIECKPANAELSIENASQLYRYFSVTDARVAILTNGVDYKFYTDVETPNRMDDRPFFTCRLDDLRKADIDTLTKFTKQAFDVEHIVEEARNLKLQTLVRKAIEAEFAEPSGDFVRIVAAKVHDGRLTGAVVDKFKIAIKSAIAAIVRDRVNDRLTSALDRTPESEDVADDEIETTEDERQGYHIVCAIAAAKIDPSRLAMRDAKSYCAILLDDNNRKTVARLHFNSSSTRFLGTFSAKEETRHRVSRPVDIYKFAGQISARIAELCD